VALKKFRCSIVEKTIDQNGHLDFLIRKPDGTHVAIEAKATTLIITAPRHHSPWLDVGCPDHLAPLLDFVSDELAKLGRRSSKNRAAEVGKPRSDRE
jgi:hypothetical protein